MTKRKPMESTLFDDIQKGMEQAIAYQRGELVEGMRVHRFERCADGTIRHEVTSVSGVQKGPT